MFTRAFICSHVNLIFSYRPLARSRAVAPPHGFLRQEGPAKLKPSSEREGARTQRPATSFAVSVFPSRTATLALRSFNSDRHRILPEVILDRFGTGRILSRNSQSVAFFLGLHQTPKMDDAILDDDVLR
jgi:hypothetical protein